MVRSRLQPSPPLPLQSNWGGRGCEGEGAHAGLLHERQIALKAQPDFDGSDQRHKRLHLVVVEEEATATPEHVGQGR